MAGPGGLENYSLSLYERGRMSKDSPSHYPFHQGRKELKMLDRKEKVIILEVGKREILKSLGKSSSQKAEADAGCHCDPASGGRSNLLTS
jgi:hypothetical protein